LDFSRTTLAGEQSGRSLAIKYDQYRGLNVDDPATLQNEAGLLHAHGQIDIFNQFSLTQSGLYSVEKIQIATEMDNPLAAAVQTYYLGDVQGKVSGANGGDVIHADADQNSLLIGTSGLNDTFRIDAPTTASNQLVNGARVVTEENVWLYGNSDSNDSIVIKVGAGTTQTNTTLDAQGALKAGVANATFVDADANTAGTQLFSKTMADGTTVKQAKVTFNLGSTATNADDVTLNIFFADAGNVDSTTLLNRIKLES
jgi:hypothetical protein